jgi:hypothetical protein
MRWLQKHFENAHFIGIMRNGYAVSEGITRKADPKHLINSWPIEMSAYQWKRSNEVMQQDAEHLKKFMWITYEDLAGDTVETLNKITDFIGVDDFETFESDRQWSIHERDEQVRNMNDESIARLSPEQIKIINEVAGDMLDEFGYTRL